jgi:long-chain fatty acid transport protein
VKRALAATTLASLLSLSGSAGAAGFAAARFGGEHGNVTEHNPTALYFNPGAIGLSEGLHLYIDGTLALRKLTWERPLAANDVPDPPDAQGANTGRAELLNVFGAPMLGATLRLGNFALGAAAYVPFGGRAHWSKNEKFVGSADYPLAADGVQRWHSIEGALTYFYGTLGLAYRIGRLSIGASGNLVHSSIVSKKAKTITGLGDPDTANEGRVELDVSGIQGSFGAGALLELLPEKLWLGASYQAQPGLGAMQLDGTLIASNDGSSATYQVTFDQALPDIVRAGARFRPLPTLELRLFGDMTRWSVMKTQCVAAKGYPCQVDATGANTADGGTLLNLRRRWQDTFAVRVGGSHWLTEPLELYVGAGYETAAVPDEMLDPELFDAPIVSGAVGARFALPGRWFIGASLTHLQYLDRDTTGKSELTNAVMPTRRADGGGRYSGFISILNANIEKEL